MIAKKSQVRRSKHVQTPAQAAQKTRAMRSFYKFSGHIALCCIAKQEEVYIEEWVKYHLACGFDYIIIYNNDDDQTILPRVLKKYVDDKKVGIIPFQGKFMQVPAYRDFFYRFKDSFEYAAIWDVDEFLVLKKHKNVKQLVKEYFRNDTGALAINLYQFGSNNQRVYRNEPVVERFTKRARRISSVVKSIYRIKSISYPSVHHSYLRPGYISIDTNRRRTYGPTHHVGDCSVAQINHYISKSQEECKKRSLRGRATYPGNRKMEHCINGMGKYSQTEDLLALDFYRQSVLQPLV